MPLKPTTHRVVERWFVATSGWGLIAIGLYLMHDVQFFDQSVEVSGQDVAFRGSVPAFVIFLGAALLAVLIIYGGAGQRRTMRTSEKSTNVKSEEAT